MKGCFQVFVVFALIGITLGGLSEFFGGLAYMHPGNMIVGAAMLAVPVLAWTTSTANRKRNAASALTAQKALDDRNAEILERVHGMPELPCDFTSPQGLILRPGEGWYYRTDATAMTPQTTVVQQGGFLGVSIPIGRTGLAINPGSFNATMTPVTSFATVGTGTVFVTSQRVVFVGQHQVAEIALGEIVNVSAYQDGMRWTLRIGNRGSSLPVTSRCQHTPIVRFTVSASKGLKLVRRSKRIPILYGSGRSLYARLRLGLKAYMGIITRLIACGVLFAAMTGRVLADCDQSAADAAFARAKTAYAKRDYATALVEARGAAIDYASCRDSGTGNRRGYDEANASMLAGTAAQKLGRSNEAHQYFKLAHDIFVLLAKDQSSPAVAADAQRRVVALERFDPRLATEPFSIATPAPISLKVVNGWSTPHLFDSQNNLVPTSFIHVRFHIAASGPVTISSRDFQIKVEGQYGTQTFRGLAQQTPSSARVIFGAPGNGLEMFPLVDPNEDLGRIGTLQMTTDQEQVYVVTFQVPPSVVNDAEAAAQTLQFIPERR